MKNAFLILSLVLFPAVSSAVPDKIVVRVGTVAPEGTPWEGQLKRTYKHIKKDTDGQIAMKMFFGGTKGDERSLVRQCRDGRLEMVGVSTAALATLVPELEVLELPFLFASSEEADFVLDNHLRRPVEQLVRKNGFVLYQWAENGWQNFGTRFGPVRSPQDLKGRKMRSQENRVHLLTWKQLNASPIEMAVSEVLPSLKTGLVEGFAQTPLFTFAAGWHQGITHYSLSRHVYQPGAIVYSKKFFDTQTPEVQAALLGNIEKDTKRGRRAVRAIEEGLIQNFVRYGTAVNTLSQEERAGFAAAAAQARKQYEQRANAQTKKLLQAIDAGKLAFRKQSKS